MNRKTSSDTFDPPNKPRKKRFGRSGVGGFVASRSRKEVYGYQSVSEPPGMVCRKLTCDADDTFLVHILRLQDLQPGSLSTRL